MVRRSSRYALENQMENEGAGCGVGCLCGIHGIIIIVITNMNVVRNIVHVGS